MTKLEATRAARALFEVAVAQGDPARVAADLTQVAALLDEHRELEAAVTNPMVPVAAKRSLIEQLATRLALTVLVQRLLLALAERDRLNTVKPIAAAFHARVLDQQRVSEGEVTTAVALNEQQAEAIAAGLSEATGRRVSLTRKVDPTIIGGAVARVGSVVFDGSLATQLRRFARELVE